MFAPGSRYATVKTVGVRLPGGRTVRAVTVRRLPAVDGEPATVAGGDRLDLIAHRRTRDAGRFWHVADANTELHAPDLVARTGRTIKEPRS